MHELILLLEVIVFVVVSLLVGLKLEVLLFGTRVIIALIVLMAAIVPAFIAIALVTSMAVAVFGTMMPVVSVTAVGNREMSRLYLLLLLLLLELVKDTSHFFGSLALLKKDNEPKRVRGHCFVCFHKLKLMRLWLHKKDLFAFLLCHG